MYARLVLVIAIASCDRPTHVEGNHPVEGVADGELRRDSEAYFCKPDTERCAYGTVDKVSPTTVHFYFRHAPRAPGFDHPRARVIPAKRLARGDVVELPNRDWTRVNNLAGGKVITDAGMYEYKDLSVPSVHAAALDRRDRRLMIGVGAIATLIAIAVLVLARRLQKRVRALRIAGTVTPIDSENIDARPDTLAVLRCHACAMPAKLATTPTIECAGCHAQVEIPADYVALVASRAKIAERLPRETAALRRARIAGNPLVALLLVGAAYGAWRLWLVVLPAITGSGSDSAATVTVLMLAFPLMFLPLALLAAAIGQLVGGTKLGRAVPALAAPRDATGYHCRGCGAPLAGARDGISELCLYCGVQNLIAPRMAASASSAKSVASALATSIHSASASFWASALAIWVPVLYVAGAIGVILYPFIFVVGLST